MDASAESLPLEVPHINQIFTDEESARKFIEQYCDSSYRPLRPMAYSTGIRFICPRGKKRKKKDNPKHTKESSIFTECPAYIWMKKLQNDSYQITKCELDHNHSLNKKVYESYSCINKRQNLGESEEFKELTNSGLKDNQIAELLSNKTGKLVTRRRVKYFREKAAITNDTRANETGE